MVLIIQSLDPTSLLLGGVVLLCLLWWLSTRRPPGLPTGPGPALPLLGHLHLLGKDPRTQFWTWRRQYGDVFSLYMGGKLVVVLASYSAIREALVNFADVFSDRPHVFMIDQLTDNSGIMGTNGTTWKEQRKTALEILRVMGMGKNVLAEKIQEEITHYVRAVKGHQEAPFNLSRITTVSISNNICSIIFGKRFHYQDSRFTTYLQRIENNFKLLGGTAILNFLPMLNYIPGDSFKVQRILTNISSVLNFINEQIADHKKMLKDDKEENGDSTDFIYSYLHQNRKRGSQGNVDTSLNEKNLTYAVADLFIAGTETTASVLQWAILFFIHHPPVQDKCFREISDIIGHHRLPTMHDKPDLPYLEATIMEVLRKGDLVPLSLQHAPAHDVKFRGYLIPKDAVIIPNLNCVLQDPEVWGDPENFRPERFIGPGGDLIRREELIPFCTGRHICLGESLARMELFLYLAISHSALPLPASGRRTAAIFGRSVWTDVHSTAVQNPSSAQNLSGLNHRSAISLLQFLVPQLLHSLSSGRMKSCILFKTCIRERLSQFYYQQSFEKFKE